MLLCYRAKVEVSESTERTNGSIGVFLCSKLFGRGGYMKKEKKKSFLTKAFWIAFCISVVLMVSVQPVFAAESETMWDRFSAIMKDFYGKLIGISTVIAVTMSATALIVRMVSKNQRTVDEATAWIKRIIITWILLNSIGLIVAYLQPLIAGGNYAG